MTDSTPKVETLTVDVPDEYWNSDLPGQMLHIPALKFGGLEQIPLWKDIAGPAGAWNRDSLDDYVEVSD